MEDYAENIIAEKKYSQVDAEGNRRLIFQEITDHKKDHTAIPIDDRWIQHDVNQTLRKTTQGWCLQILWQDGTTSRKNLHNIKKSIQLN